MNLLRTLSDDIATVVETVRPAVLHLRMLARGNTAGTGSGFVCGPGGLALTNHHVVAGADAVEATLHDGRSLLVDVLGADPATDLALLRLPDAAGTTMIELRDTASLRVGDFALAVGCPHGLSHSVAIGILSGLGRSLRGRSGRTIEDVIQTDAPLNPGNSGGPLLDAEGRAIGVATAIFFPAQGLCFAVPAATALVVIPELLANGRVVRGFLGIGIDGVQLTAAQAQLLGWDGFRALAIAGVTNNGPAANAGLQRGDLLAFVDGRAIRSAGDLYAVLDRKSIGRELTVRVLRGGAMLLLNVVPRELAQAG
ncbi:MAG TPA: trypsin-like peptidase domain-containing protein [Planctomycetota bacterium]|nr:trypsin-like peptidase domain-containing protein [Planctomycetota bacterium]